MEMPRLSHRTWLSVILVAAYVYYVWAVAHALSNETDDEYASARFYNGVSQFCYSVARWFGHVGLESELKCAEILKQGRMI